MTALYLSREGASYDMQHGLELTRAVPVLGDFHPMPEGGGGRPDPDSSISALIDRNGTLKNVRKLFRFRVSFHNFDVR